MLKTQNLPAVNTYEEVLAYERLYYQNSGSLKKVSNQTVNRNELPTQAIEEELFMPPYQEELQDYLNSKIGNFHVAVDGTPQYPKKLQDANERVPLIYYQGDINLVEKKSVSIVGARKATQDGLARASKLAQELAKKDICVVSGLAAGIDTAALTSAIKNNGRVIGVIGTPIDEFYPKENEKLQKAIAYGHLLISQVPFYYYSKQPFETKACYFKERNVTMAAISDATVIVQASNTSGTLIQASACIKQGRPLFIMKSCLENSATTWTKRFVDAGAKILTNTDELLEVIDK